MILPDIPAEILTEILSVSPPGIAPYLSPEIPSGYYPRIPSGTSLGLVKKF